MMLCKCRYIATVEGVVSKRHLIVISEGTIIDGVHCTPDSVELLPRQPDISRPRLRIVVCAFYFSLLLFFPFNGTSLLLNPSVTSLGGIALT